MGYITNSIFRSVWKWAVPMCGCSLKNGKMMINQWMACGTLIIASGGKPWLGVAKKIIWGTRKKSFHVRLGMFPYKPSILIGNPHIFILDPQTQNSHGHSPRWWFPNAAASANESCSSGDWALGMATQHGDINKPNKGVSFGGCHHPSYIWASKHTFCYGKSSNCFTNHLKMGACVKNRRGY